MTQLAISLPAARSRASHGNPLTRWFGDRGVRTKILAAVGVVAIVASTIGVVSIQKLSAMDSAAARINSEALASVDQLDAVGVNFRQVRIDVLSIAIHQGAAQVADQAALKVDTQGVQDALAAYEKTALPGRQALIDSVKTKWADYIKVRDTKAIPAALSGDLATFRTVQTNEIVPLVTNIRATLDQLSLLEHNSAKAIVASAHSTFTAARTLMLILLIGGLLIGIGLALIIGRMITRPLKAVSEALAAVAEGDLTQHVTVTTTDEVGVMGESVNKATESLRATVNTISASAQALAAASEQFATTSDEIARSAEETSTQAGMVASASEQVSVNVQTVAAGTEEMGASIREIAQNAADAARVAASAVSAASSTNDIVSKLGTSSVEIGNFIKVITSIAQQTNLLALNATIEAARAGEAGKGFAVVANEVKDLAQETAKATEDISRRVETIQEDTGSAISAIAEISEVIQRINDYQTTIAAAVEEQTATTNEMARNVAEAATGSSEIARNVVGVASAAGLTSSSVEESQNAASNLARMSSELQALVGQFRY